MPDLSRFILKKQTWTRAEFQRALSTTYPVAREILACLVRDGYVIRSGSKKYRRIDGIVVRVPAYTLTPKGRRHFGVYVRCKNKNRR